ncbi:MAG: FG-GAP-like repeat-containing protein [Thermoplasmatota archaeon]
MEYDRFRLLVPLTAVIILASLLAVTDPGEGNAPEDAPTRAGEVTFTNVSAEVGLSHIRGNFFSWGDFDRDGNQDLLVDGKRLFRNSGPPEFVFTDVTERAGIDRPVNSGVFADYDNDGWMDIFCGGGRGSSDHPVNPDVLWHNEKDGTFTDATSDAGSLSDTFPTVAGGWADVDRDGFVDLYMVNYENGTYRGYPDNFWFNNGDGTFRNGTEYSGMDEYDEPYQGRGVSFSDFDNDGFTDAYVSNYRIMPNYLYRNMRNGTMEESASALGVEGHGNVHPITQEGPYYGHSLGSSWGDLDNDGDMDLWVTNLAHKDAWRGPICDDSYLFENLGPGEEYAFIDVREQSGIPLKQIPGSVLGDGDELMVSSSLADYDNDGDLDLFLPQIYGDVPYAYSYLYRNEGGMTFTDVSSESGIRVWNTYGSAWCDYNKDGWIDLVTGGGTWDPELSQTTDYMIHLYRNNGATADTRNDWVEVSLVGRGSNTAAIGARVKLESDTDGDGDFDLSMIREVQGGTAAHGQQDSMILHFGLGGKTYGLRTTTTWPMGREVVAEGVEPNMLVQYFEPTEDISLNMTITNFDPGEQGSELTLMMENPTVYPVSYSEFELSVAAIDLSSTSVLTYDGRIERGENQITLSGPSLPDDRILNVTVTVIRTYPPMTGKVSDGLYYDPVTNIPPVPVLRGPGTAGIGIEVVFDGSGSYDPDGSVASFSFELGDGTVSGWQEDDSFSHSYSQEGTYDVRLSVMDDRGSISLVEDQISIEVTGTADGAPLAVIDYIRPESADEGERIRFKGHGIASEGRTISGYEWTSSIDGLLGVTSYLTTESLSPGVHSISLRVSDSEERFSDPVFGEVEIKAIVVEELWVEIHPLGFEGPYSGRIEFRGSSGPGDRVEYVEVRLDSGPWQRARTVPDWTFEVDCGELGPGTHRLDARSFGDRYYSIQYASYEFEVGSVLLDGTGQTAGNGSGTSEDRTLELWWIIAGSGIVVLTLSVAVVVAVVLSSSRRRSMRSRRGAIGRSFVEKPVENGKGIPPEEDDGNVETFEALVIE